MFQNIVVDTLIASNIITSQNPILEISNPAGGINRSKFKKIIDGRE